EIEFVMAGGVSMTATLKPEWLSRASASPNSSNPTLAKRGVGIVREFHHSERLPWGSQSINATGPTPAISASTARWPDSVVFPEPPFCEANTSTYISFLRTARIARMSRRRASVSRFAIEPRHFFASREAGFQQLHRVARSIDANCLQARATALSPARQRRLCGL